MTEDLFRHLRAHTSDKPQKRFYYLWRSKSENIEGNICTFETSEYQISVIDDGYGSSQDLYEIGIICKSDGEFVSLPGITEEDGIKGWLTLNEIDAILMKIASMTGEDVLSVCPPQSDY